MDPSQATQARELENSATAANRVSKIIPLLKDAGPSIYAIAIAMLYGSGFLVLNASLAKAGVLDIEFADARYLLAGASFVLYLLCFYLFAGRAVLFSPKWVAEDLTRMKNTGAAPAWGKVVYAHSFIHSAFFCCLSAAMFSTFAIGATESAVFYSVLAIAFVVSYTIDINNFDLKYPRSTEIFNIVSKAVALYAFFAYGGSGAMLTTFINYVVIFVFINMVIDRFARYRVTADQLTFTGFYAAFFFLGTAVAYGTTLYEKVNSRVGGSRPQTVSVGLSDDAKTALAQVISPSNGTLEGKLVHQTQTYTYIATLDSTIRVRAQDVLAMVAKPPTSEPDFWKLKADQMRASAVVLQSEPGAPLVPISASSETKH